MSVPCGWTRPPGSSAFFGVSSSLREVRRAGEVAARCPGARAVDNLVAVECARPPTDAELQDAARSAAASVDPRVEVEVKNGIAVLRGQVARPELLDGVIRAVEGTAGIKALRSEVTFTGPAAL